MFLGSWAVKLNDMASEPSIYRPFLVECPGKGLLGDRLYSFYPVCSQDTLLSL